MIADAYGRPMQVQDIPAEDPVVYDMICKADTVGVFQIESRAQMSMLPRLKPRCFYDLVIEVAIVRPGPIQGDMVHPYLRRREGREAVNYPSEALRAVLGKTLGVPLFQEQAMKIAIVAAGFTPSEADRLRRSMAAFRRAGTIQEMGEKLVAGMIAKGYEPDFAERCFRQLEGFGEYGFPESHAASFALIVYVSCWLKRHYPDVFLAAMLNAQPLGFYAPAQLVRDARQHGVMVRAPDVNASHWDSTLETLASGEGPRATPEGGARRAVRLGLRQIKGLAEKRSRAPDRGAGTWRICQHRGRRPARRAGARGCWMCWRALTPSPRWARHAGRRAGARGRWPVPTCRSSRLRGARGRWPTIPAPPCRCSKHLKTWCRIMRACPCRSKATPWPSCAGIFTVWAISPAPNSRACAPARAPGWPVWCWCASAPARPRGVIFATLEDETGTANVIIWPHVFARFRRAVIGAKLLGVTGELQREGDVIHLVAAQARDWSEALDALTQGDEAGGFQSALARADEVARPGADARERPKRKFAASEAESIIPASRDFR